MVTISVIIPARPSDVPAAEALAKTLSFADEVIIDTSRGGCARAKNHGAEQANGDILFFLDADVRAVHGDLRPLLAGDTTSDYWTPERIVMSPEVSDWYSNIFSSWASASSRHFCWTSGVSMLVRRTSFFEHEGFNENAHGEDTYYAYYAYRNHLKARSVPIEIVVGRKFRHFWEYFVPNDGHASSRGKEK